MTDPVDPDSDLDGMTDGEEDVNSNGVEDKGETDPIAFLFVEQTGVCDSNEPCRARIHAAVDQAGAVRGSCYYP